jgi:hypothetical protein
MFMQVRRWIMETFTASGAELEMGSKPYSTFVREGLPGPCQAAA